MKKIDEPQNYNTQICDRCDEEYCDNCVDFETVDFETAETETPRGINPSNAPVNWKGKNVCTWCYNQLIDNKQRVIT